MENFHSEHLKGRVPGFGDFTTRNPKYSQKAENFPPSPSIRYTTEKGCKIYRGKHVKGKSNSVIYRQHAKDVVVSEDYPGPRFSFGDRYILEVAEGVKNPGGPMQWIKASEIHHITLLSRRIAGISVKSESEVA